MSEKTPESPQDSEPNGTDPVETPIPDDHRPISAEAIVNAPPTREQPPAQNSDQAYAQAYAQANPPTRSVLPNAGSAQQHPSYPGNAYPGNPQYGNQQQAPNPQSGRPPQAPNSQPGGQRQMSSQRQGNQLPTNQLQPGYPQPAYRQSTSSQQPGYAYSTPMPGADPTGQMPNGQMPTQTQMPTQQQMPMPMPGGAPPRRKKPRPESVAYSPVTGAMPLSDSEATEVPADGPIEWPHSRTGFVGVANLVLSAVLAVIWAWIPLGLLFTGIGGIFALGLGVLALVVWVLVQQGANIVERYRAELIYGDRIPVPKIARSVRPSGFGRFLHNQWLTVRSGSFWRSTAHHYIKMLLGAVVVGGTVVGICGAIFGIFGAINPDGISAGFFAASATGLGRVGIVIGSIIILASSLAILWFAPYLDRALDRSLLTPPRTAALQAEVTELDRARMAGIDAAAAERLRIERDLHDGAQPRLVALSMTLGMAKSKIDTDPERAKELVSEAHAEAKGIVNELRQLARGIHPAVLTDRGLDAAVSALAGRSTIPVEVDVRLQGRIEREAEAVAYFVVAECLTNIAKHSGATHARVFVAPVEAGVQIVVTDNGQGGARIDRSGRHTGIAGLVDRVEAARGTLNLTSPAGGPTTVVVEVPCAS